MATTIKDLKEAMKKGVVKFQYMKKNGTLRTATGTMNMNLINDNYSFRGGEGPSKHGYTSYWDTDKGDWRCFNDASLVGIL